jgi:hypothetical protein
MDFPIAFIGLHGTLQSGKDLTAKALMAYAQKTSKDNLFSYQIEHVSFANPLKDGMIAIFGGERRNYFGTNDDKNEAMTFWRDRLGDNFTSYRSAIQWIGTELFREKVHPDFWLFATELRIREYLAAEGDEFTASFRQKRTIFVAADVRFDNEAKFILDHGGVVAHILRADGVKAETKGIAGHKSEAGLSPEFVSKVYTCELGDHDNVAAELMKMIGKV